jgi:hypothetical protein
VYIHDPDAIERVLGGELAETSLGQLIDADEYKPATSSMRADVVVPVGIANHFSLEEVGHARAGRGCTVLTDSLDLQDITQEDYMPAPEDYLAQLTELTGQVSKLSLQVSTLTTQLEEATAGSEALQAKLDSAETSLEEAGAKAKETQAQLDAVEEFDVGAAVEEELKFRAELRKGLPAGYSFAGKTRRQAQLDSIKHLGGKVADDADDALVSGYLQAQLDSVSEDVQERRGGGSGRKTPDEIRAAKRAAARGDK